MIKRIAFGKYLADLREHARLTLEKAAHNLSIDLHELIHMESGDLFPSENRLKSIALLYGVPFAELRDIWEHERKADKIKPDSLK